MTPNGIFQILFFTAVVIALAKPMGTFMAKVFAGERTWLHRIFRPVESGPARHSGTTRGPLYPSPPRPQL